MPARKKATRWKRRKRSRTKKPTRRRARRKPPRRRWKTRSKSVFAARKKGRLCRPFSFSGAAFVVPLDGLQHLHRREVVGQQLRPRLRLDVALRREEFHQVVAQLVLLGQRRGAR